MFFALEVILQLFFRLEALVTGLTQEFVRLLFLLYLLLLYLIFFSLTATFF